MKARVLCLCWLLLLAAPAGAAEVEHVVVVSIDGLPPAYWLEPDAYGLKIPNLRRLAAEGAFAEGMRSVFPTLTYPAHTSMVTGVSPARHGIFLNSAPDPEMKFGLRWYAEEIRARTVYQAAEERGLRTALVFWPVSMGALADAVFPEFWRGDRDDQKLLRAISTPGLVRGVEQRFSDFTYNTPPNTRDKDLTHIAVHLIQTLRPHLLLLHLIEVDHILHEVELDHPLALLAVENADTQLGRIIEALEKAGVWSRTVLFVVSDHGFARLEQVVRPSLWLQQAELLKLNERGEIAEWKAAPICGGGVCEVLLKDRSDRRTQEKVLKLFHSLAQDSANGIGRVYSPEESAALSPDAGAAIILEAAPGVHFSSSHRGLVREASWSKAGHGYDPDRPDQLASFIAAGAGVRSVQLKQVSMLDLAPTIALLLELDLPGAEGKPLIELFEPVVEEPAAQ